MVKWEHWPEMGQSQQCYGNMNKALCEMCPNTEFFLVCIFPYSVRMRENTDQKKLRIWTFFTQWNLYGTLCVVADSSIPLSQD